MRKQIKNKAFTLIELLVVISIIALLLSILMPSLQKTKELARRVVCTSNLHSWGLSYALYANDYNDKVCPALIPTADENGQLVIKSWVESLREYYGDNEEIRLCPSARKVGTELYLGQKVGATLKAWEIGGEKGSYGMNGFAQAPDFETYGYPREYHWGKVTAKKASEIPLLVDCVWREAYVFNNDEPSPEEDVAFTYLNVNQINRFVMNRHSKAVNMVMLDSSTRRVELENMWNFYWNKGEFEKRMEVEIPWLIGR
jgi:prepilin-type N-terminal cleavage/methylation domain-containing protein